MKLEKLNLNKEILETVKNFVETSCDYKLETICEAVDYAHCYYKEQILDYITDLYRLIKKLNINSLKDVESLEKNLNDSDVKSIYDNPFIIVMNKLEDGEYHINDYEFWFEYILDYYTEFKEDPVRSFFNDFSDYGKDKEKIIEYFLRTEEVVFDYENGLVVELS